MITLRQILCPVDFSESSVRALAHAGNLAERYGAHLKVLHVAPTFDAMPVRSPDLTGPVRIVSPASREEVLAALKRVAVETGMGSDTAFVAEAGDPTATITDAALAMSADLLVMGTHGQRGFTRFMLGSVTERILRDAPCPVLTVPPGVPATRAAAVTFKQVLCPIDFSSAALQALGFAIDLAGENDGSVTLLHAIEWLAEEEPRAHAHFGVQEYRRHLTDDADERLRALLDDESRTRCRVNVVVATGRAYREVLRTAGSLHADLIVMGAHGRGGLGLTLFGSTTQQVVRGAACPVLTVRGVNVPTPK